MMALPAAAVRTSDSVTAPTPESSTVTFTLRVESLVRACEMASEDPCTSALTTTFSSLGPPGLDLAKRSSRVARFIEPSSLARAFWARCSATSLADFSSETTLKSSPAVGTPDRPRTSTG